MWLIFKKSRLERNDKNRLRQIERTVWNLRSFVLKDSWIPFNFYKKSTYFESVSSKKKGDFWRAQDCALDCRNPGS